MAHGPKIFGHTDRMTSPTTNVPLPPGFQLESYRIDRPIASGGFSIVYLAHDEEGGEVAIKEYLPFQLARRTGNNPVPEVSAENRKAFDQSMKAFFEEGRLLAMVKHPNIVHVLNFFRANETAYMVMRYEDGRTLTDYCLSLQKAGRMISEDFLRNVFVRLLSGLREVHAQKLLHLDIKPDNVYLRHDGDPVLLDFGATRFGLGPKDRTLVHVNTPGFAAPEQQGSGEPQGPWTDIYSIGATLYACLASSRPQSARERREHDDLVPAQTRWHGQYSLQLLELIDWCLHLPINERPQSAYALQKVLNGELLDLVDPSWFDTPN